MHCYSLSTGTGSSFAEGINIDRENFGERIEALYFLVVYSSPGFMKVSSQILSPYG